MQLCMQMMCTEYFLKKSKLKSEIRSIFLKINFCDWSAAAVANQRRVAVFLADTVTLVFLGNTHTRSHLSSLSGGRN